jgi:glycosyltransferase involved in cell wall biosynthesis
MGAWFTYAISCARALKATATSRNVAKVLRMIMRGEWVFVLRTARKLTLERLAHLQGGDLSDVSAELFEVPPFDPGVPLVSVVIPCVNHGAFVGEALASVLAQTFPSIETIVVDGGSDDGTTPALVSALAGPRVRVLLREGPPRVVGDNRNFGIAHARGRYICCLDADDLLAPTYIEKALFVMEQGGFDVVGASLVEFGARNQEWRVPSTPTLNDFMLHNQTICCALFRRDVWADVGGYSELTLQRDGIPEDWEFWIRIAARGARFRNISGETLMRYRVRGAGTSLSSASGLPSRNTQRRAINDRLRHLLTPEAVALSRRESARRLRPANSISAMAHAQESDSAVRLAAVPRSLRTLMIVLPHFYVGGVERLLSQVCAGLRRKGWRVVVVATGVEDPSGGDSLHWFEAATPECYALNRFLPREEWRRFTWQLLRTRRPDVLLNVGSPLLYDLLPDIAAEFPALARLDLLLNLVGHTNNHLSRRVFLTGALCENREVLGWLTDAAGWQPERVAMVGNGVDTARFTPGPRPQALADQLGVEPCDIVVGWAGRMAEEKCPEAFVRIAHRCRDIPGLRFLMAGDGPLARVVAASAKRHGPAMLGFIEDIENFYRLCDVFVLTSRIDGRPNAIIEAKASGCAIIASRLAGIMEIVEDGLDGILIDPADEASFEAKLRLLISDRTVMQRMKEAAIKSVNKFCIETTVENYDRALISSKNQVIPSCSLEFA